MIINNNKNRYVTTTKQGKLLIPLCPIKVTLWKEERKPPNLKQTPRIYSPPKKSTNSSQNSAKSPKLDLWNQGEILEVHLALQKNNWLEYWNKSMAEKYFMSIYFWFGTYPSDLLFECHIKYSNGDFRLKVFICVHFFNFLAEDYVTFNINHQS